MFKKNLLYLLLLFLFVHPNSFAQAEKTKSNTDTLEVGIAGSEPFVFNSKSGTSGIAIELWEDIAVKKKWNYNYKSFESVDAALHALKNGKVDLVVGPISITANRLESMQFSQPFYNSSLAIVSRKDELSLWDKIKPFFSLKLLMAVFVFLIILAIVGTLLWLAERKESPDQFPSKPLNGIGTGMWLAIVTMSTTGYGDKAPITLAGRVIAGSWMVISIIFATSMVAGIASTLTLSSLGDSTISNIEQLSSKKAATITSSPSESFLKENKIKIVSTDNLEDAIDKLKDKKVDAVVYDRPQLLYFMKKHQGDPLYIAKAEYYKQGYGFAFRINDKLVYDVNRALLAISENHEKQRIVEYYLDKDE